MSKAQPLCFNPWCTFYGICHACRAVLINFICCSIKTASVQHLPLALRSF